MLLLAGTCGAMIAAPAATAWGAASQPSSGKAPRVAASRVSQRVTGIGKSVRAHKPAPPLKPAHGRVVKPPAPTTGSNNKAAVGGVTRFGPAHPGAGRLIIPPPSAAHPPKLRRFTPSTFYSSTQLDSFSAQCGFGVNETTIAQSTDNPNLVVAGANTYYDNSGNCQDSHTGVYYSSDGGQHWKFEVMPGLIDPFSGDPVVTYDPVRQVFLFAFVEAKRNDSTVGRIGVEASSDGVNWSRNTTLDSNHSNYSTDKPSITVDQNPSSPHYGRVLVAWTEFFGNNAVYQTAFSDDGGVTWHGGDSSVNQTSHECGNGTSAAFNANGEVMVAWADCSSNVNSMYDEVSADGGTTWHTGIDHQITTTNPLAGAEDPNAADCFLDHGGSAFRCNSFPTLAGDPNSGDAGGTAFVVVWADVRSTTQNAQTANVSQLIGLSTVDDGSTWNGGPSFSFHFMAFNDFGDKFFPAASFSPSGRLTVSYSSREDDASSGNPNGKSFNEHQTEAASLTNLRNNSYVSYTTDGTLGDPGSLVFVGDYAGNSSLDQNFDTFPVWTDLRNGFPSARTQDLCYTDCMTFLSPDSPLFVNRAGGSSFADFYSMSMDPTTGSGNNFWNVVALREGADGTSVDDDAFLAPNRYYNSTLAASAFSPSFNDYLVINGNVGHAPDTAYFPQVKSFSTVGGFYSLEWDAGHLTLGTSFTASMGSSNVARVYDTFLSTSTTYFFALRRNGGSSNTTNYSLALHSASKGSEQGRPNAVADSGRSAPGSGPALIQYNTGSDPSQFDGLVVVNNNGGSGSYTLYRDTVAPSGSVSIDGGAQSTNSTTLHLSLSASNPTAGDPVSDMAFSVDGGAYSAFQSFSSSANVNIAATEGSHTVAVKYRNGAGAVSTPATSSIYLVQTAPTITSVSPNAGPTAGGNTVTINGTHLAPGATVKFSSGGSALPTTFVSSTQVKVVAPAMASNTVNVFVTTPAGTSPAVSGDQYTFDPQPVISSLSPNAGPTGGGNTVTINGSGFLPGATAKFSSGGSSLATTFVSGNQLRVTAPSHSAGVFHVFVTTPGGTSTATNNDFYAFGSPAITSLSPNNGPKTGGNTVTVNGSGFVPGATVKFSGAGSPLSTTFVSGTQVKVVAPAQSPNTVNVFLTTPAGTSAVVPGDQYTFNP